MILNKRYISRIFLAIVLTTIPLFTQCSKQKEIKGKNFASREVMTNVMIDIHLIDGITNDMKYYRKYNPGDSINLYNKIFEKYKIDSTIYNRTLLEYSQHPELLNDIYDDVLLALNLKLDKVNTEEQPPDKKAETSANPKKSRNKKAN